MNREEAIKKEAIEILREQGMNDLADLCADAEVVEDRTETHLVLHRGEDTEISVCIRQY